jgi:hypothetical protein
MCGPSYTMCGAGCANLNNNHDNCGMCGHACAAMTEACVSGTCVPYVPYHGWTSPLAGCDTGGWDTTEATPLGGFYGYNTGDSDACRAWKLAATVCTVEPIPYSDMNNWQCPSSGGFTDPAFGTFCDPGPDVTQFACSTCPGACNAGSCFAGPISLRDCSDNETALP